MSLDLLEAAATEFGELLDQVVFIGGATIGLWITDPTSRAPRVTYDVDVVAEITTAEIASAAEDVKDFVGAGVAELMRLRDFDWRSTLA